MQKTGFLLELAFKYFIASSLNLSACSCLTALHLVHGRPSSRMQVFTALFIWSECQNKEHFFSESTGAFPKATYLPYLNLMRADTQSRTFSCCSANLKKTLLIVFSENRRSFIDFSYTCHIQWFLCNPHEGAYIMSSLSDLDVSEDLFLEGLMWHVYLKMFLILLLTCAHTDIGTHNTLLLFPLRSLLRRNWRQRERKRWHVGVARQSWPQFSASISSRGGAARSTHTCLPHNQPRKSQTWKKQPCFWLLERRLAELLSSWKRHVWTPKDDCCDSRKLPGEFLKTAMICFMRFIKKELKAQWLNRKSIDFP